MVHPQHFREELLPPRKLRHAITLLLDPQEKARYNAAQAHARNHLGFPGVHQSGCTARSCQATRTTITPKQKLCPAQIGVKRGPGRTYGRLARRHIFLSPMPRPKAHDGGQSRKRASLESFEPALSSAVSSMRFISRGHCCLKHIKLPNSMGWTHGLASSATMGVRLSGATVEDPPRLSQVVFMTLAVKLGGRHQFSTPEDELSPLL